jgi:hypothetical protein
MTLMARAAHIPSRYVTGFYPIQGNHPANDPDPHHWLMNESEAHAWSELFFQGIGWVPFDATEGAAEMPGAERGEATQQTWYQQGWFVVALDVSIALVLLGGIAFAFVSYRRLSQAKAPSREDVGLEYGRFARILQKASGKRRLPSQTPDEYWSSTRQALGDNAPSAELLNGRFVDALYSPLSISEEILRELRQGTEELKRELAASGQSKSRGSAGGSKR